MQQPVHEHDTLYLSAPVNALVEGIYRQNTTLGQLREHGDFGLGTFNDLDGELVLLGGSAYQVTGTGEVRRPADDVLTPFACVCFFRELTFEDVVSGFADMAALMSLLERSFPSPNMMYALRIDGDFEFVRTRSVPRQDYYRPLVEVTKDQPVFEMHSLSGTLAGFYTPRFMASMSVPGVHLHFISEDRAFGGHLLQCRAVRARIGIQILRSLRMDLPVTLDYMTADLQRDTEKDLEMAEKE
ncbi:acetolactate decarboxylase [Desulfonatronum thiosulfatophilum]|uniref:Alpha-acetolactate decarboxylase n=1 Tax=Desulfonatronum thiosulfatophilum TaxID=617002 RepID=A0A1G6BZ57_9BACT|nr:acetolactate decarboxylase [Desulfonatronum thiosulfatophilum]SDB25921.1 acetolactate decarboxylase [Desulfonatronum thiosulfatophilum]